VTFLTYQQAGEALGFDGAALYLEDLFRAAPFDPASTVPDASLSPTSSETTARSHGPSANHPPHRLSAHAGNLNPTTLRLCQQYLREIKDLPAFEGIRDRAKRPGSNGWVINGAHTTSGRPLLANDNHLPLGVPSTLYPIHLQAGPVNVTGNSFAGVPFVILGHNPFISWGATTHYLDVTDTFQEQLVSDATSPSGLSTVYQGQLEHVIPVPEVFRKNNFDSVPDNLAVLPPGDAIPPVTLIVPRRNNGPIIKLDAANGTALSIQYTGFSPTRELDTFLIWNEAKNLADFRRGLPFFNVGSVNMVYCDVHGNIAHFTSGDMPIREDLQAGVVNGLPPFFIRSGSGGNEWLALQHPQPNQAVPYEILPAEEMPHIVNPPAGWLLNCNNDPIGNTLDNDPLNQLRPGGGIYYLNRDYETLRNGRVTQLLRQKLANGGRVAFADMQKIQADTVLIDAQVFVPHILRAWASAQTSPEPLLAALASNPAVAEAVRRLGQWDFTTPTGITEGYDASDAGGRLSAFEW
jgi:penicillin amidase